MGFSKTLGGQDDVSRIDATFDGCAKAQVGSLPVRFLRINLVEPLEFLLYAQREGAIFGFFLFGRLIEKIFFVCLDRKSVV